MDERGEESIGLRRGLPAVGVALLLVVAAVAAAAAGGVGPFEPEPEPYESVVVFRNDDVQPYYRTEALEAVNSVFVEEGVPVTHAVIPTAGGEPITEGPRVCDYLVDVREQHGALVEYAVHGHAHRPATEFFGRSEFGGRPADEQRAMIEEATAIHESCTGARPDTFVAPFNTYDDATVEALADAGYTTVSGGPEFTAWYFDRAGPFEAGGLVHVPNTRGLVANWTTHEFHSGETLRDAFDAARANGSVYVQMLHHPTFTTAPNESTVSDRKLDRLRSFVRYVDDHDVKVMTLGGFGEAYASGRIQRTDDGWELVEPGEPIPGGLPAALPGVLMAVRTRSGRPAGRPRTPRGGAGRRREHAIGRSARGRPTVVRPSRRHGPRSERRGRPTVVRPSRRHRSRSERRGRRRALRRGPAPPYRAGCGGGNRWPPTVGPSGEPTVRADSASGSTFGRSSRTFDGRSVSVPVPAEGDDHDGDDGDDGDGFRPAHVVSGPRPERIKNVVNSSEGPVDALPKFSDVIIRPEPSYS